MDGLTPVFVSHHQFQVLAGGETGDGLDLYTVGDSLLQVTGGPVPPPFDDQQRTWNRLLSDPLIPTTTVTTPTGVPNNSQQAIALPAIWAAVHDDPLAGVVDAVYYAALIYGDEYRSLLAAASTRLAQLSGSR